MNEKEMEDSETGKSGFKVSDRRKFSAEGEPLPKDDETEDRSQQVRQESPAGPSGTGAPQANAGEEQKRGQEIDFSGFILSLATSAMAHLGELPDPATGKRSEDLPSAHQMIDIISMLKEKTKGNLDSDEGRLIEDILYELRMKYLSKSKAVKL